MKAAAKGIKPVVLELGGKNPMIVFQDADLERALDDAVDGGFGNCGQVCSSVSRLILHKNIKKDFLQALAKKAKALSVGPGMNNPDLGPLVSYDQYNRVTGYIETGIQEGAKLVSGGKRPDNLKRGISSSRQCSNE